MNLKDRLGDIETNCRNCLHGWLLSMGLNSTHFHSTRVPVEEPSTASQADIVRHKMKGAATEAALLRVEENGL